METNPKSEYFKQKLNFIWKVNSVFFILSSPTKIERYELNLNIFHNFFTPFCWRPLYIKQLSNSAF